MDDGDASATYEFDGDLLIVQQVGALENDTKGTLSDLLADAVVYADNVARRGSHRGRRLRPVTDRVEGVASRRVGSIVPESVWYRSITRKGRRGREKKN